MKFRVNMTTAELDLCPDCKALIFKADAGLLDIWQNGPWYADTDTPHKHQPVTAAGG